MKRFLALATLMLGAAILTATPALADTDAPATEATETPAAAESTEAATVSVADMLSEVEYLTKAKPKKKAVVYFFLRSHAKCGFCRKITPELITLYKAMKGKGAELIMLSGDSDLEVAKKWAKEAGMTYPIITNATIGAIKFPAGGSGGSPNVVAVTADGKTIENTSGASGCTKLIGNWKELVKEAKAEKKAAKAAAKKAKKKAKAAEEAAEDVAL
jgi:thiol-disulfide isomerase/thioredoxin